MPWQSYLIAPASTRWELNKFPQHPSNPVLTGFFLASADCDIPQYPLSYANLGYKVGNNRRPPLAVIPKTQGRAHAQVGEAVDAVRRGQFEGQGRAVHLARRRRHVPSGEPRWFPVVA